MKKLYKQPAIPLLFLSTLLVLPHQAVIAGSEPIVASEQEARVIAAKVNGRPIFKDVLEQRVLAKASKTRGKAGKKSELPEVTPGRLRAVLMEEIAAELFYQGGLKLDLPGADKKIAEEIERIKASFTDVQRQTYSDKKVKDYVQRRFYIHEYMVVENLIDPKASEAEVRAYYEETKQGYAQKVDKLRVRHVLVKAAEDASEDEHKLARAKIEKAQQLLLEGKSFSDIAKEYSEDGNEYPGNNGFITRGFMPEEFDEVAFSLEIEEISKVVKSKLGYHVIEVLEIRPKGSIPPYSSLRAFFEEYLSGELKIKKAPAHVRQLRKKANIEILLSADEKS